MGGRNTRLLRLGSLRLEVTRESVVFEMNAKITRNPTHADLILEGPNFSLDTGERLEGCFIVVAFRPLGGVVCHHGGRESVASWSDEHACRLRKKEIRVASDRIVEARLMEWEECRVLLWSDLCTESASVTDRLLRQRLAIFSGNAS